MLGVLAPLVFLESYIHSIKNDSYISNESVTLILHHAMWLMMHSSLPWLMMLLLMMHATHLIPSCTFKCAVGSVASTCIALQVLLLYDVLATVPVHVLLWALIKSCRNIFLLLSTSSNKLIVTDLMNLPDWRLRTCLWIVLRAHAASELLL